MAYKVVLSHSSSVTFESDGAETAENVVVTIGATANKMAIVILRCLSQSEFFVEITPLLLVVNFYGLE